MRKQRGFTLIELLIVIAIILVIAAIAIPNLMRSKMAANEASAVASLRMVVTAEASYSTSYPNLGYASTLAELGPVTGGGSPSSAGAALIDNLVASGSKSGYVLAPVAAGFTGDIPEVGFEFSNTPATVGSSGQRQFCTNESGVLRYEQGGSGCNPTTSQPLQ
jgi:prepilin-type N-terminal cleavage/methylation domain-containing protein